MEKVSSKKLAVTFEIILSMIHNVSYIYQLRTPLKICFEYSPHLIIVVEQGADVGALHLVVALLRVPPGPATVTDNDHLTLSGPTIFFSEDYQNPHSFKYLYCMSKKS